MIVQGYFIDIEWDCDDSNRLFALDDDDAIVTIEIDDDDYYESSVIEEMLEEELANVSGWVFTEAFLDNVHCDNVM